MVVGREVRGGGVRLGGELAGVGGAWWCKGGGGVGRGTSDCSHSSGEVTL